MKRSETRILVVAADPAAAVRIRVALDGQDFSVAGVAGGVDAIESVRAAPPDLLVLDDALPDMSGLEVCRIVKSLTPSAFVPVILMRAGGDGDALGPAFGAGIGADDCVNKPLQPHELRARVASMLRIKALEDALRAKRDQLETLTRTDELSGVLNHHAMHQRLRDEFMRSQRYNQALTLLMTDVDHFRDVNERHGHIGGDDVIVEVGVALQESVREVDIVAHFGADKFLVILPRAQFAGALAVAERIRQAISDRPMQAGDTSYRMSLSVGMACFPNKNVRDAGSLLRLAEQALMQAKQRGRNCICVQQQFGYRTFSDGASAARAHPE